MARSSNNDPYMNFRFRAYALNVPTSGAASGVEWAIEAVAGGESYKSIFGGFGADHDSNQPSAGFTHIDLPPQFTNQMLYRENIDPSRASKGAGLTSFGNVTFRRGMSNNTDFVYWATQVHSLSVATINPNLGNIQQSFKLVGDYPAYRKDIVVECLARKGNVERSWLLVDCWPSTYRPGTFEASTEDHLFEEMEITCEACIDLSSLEEIMAVHVATAGVSLT